MYPAFWVQARSSVGEHYLDTVGVGSSILPAPTGIALSNPGGSPRAAGALVWAIMTAHDPVLMAS
jgi:hypothetical protein